jgi:hypothetical protein
MAGPGSPPPFIALRNMLRDSENLVKFGFVLNNLALRSCRFYDKHDIGIEDFQLRDGANMVLFMFLMLMSTSSAKKLIGDEKISGARGLLSGVSMDLFEVANTEGAWDFSLEFLDMQPREQISILL